MKPNKDLDEILADKSGAVSYNQKQAILQWVSEAVVGQNEPEYHDVGCYFYNGPGYCHCPAMRDNVRNNLRAEQREILRKEGLKDED